MELKLEANKSQLDESYLKNQLGKIGLQLVGCSVPVSPIRYEPTQTSNIKVRINKVTKNNEDLKKQLESQGYKVTEMKQKAIVRRESTYSYFVAHEGEGYDRTGQAEDGVQVHELLQPRQ